MSFSTIVESGVLGYIFNFTDIFSNVDYETYYVGLASGFINTSGTNIAEVEFDGGSYARVEVDNDSTTWCPATGLMPAVSYNKIAINFPTPTADWGTATHFFIVNDNDDLVSCGGIVPGKEIYTGETVKFDVSGLYLTAN